LWLIGLFVASMVVVLQLFVLALVVLQLNLQNSIGVVIGGGVLLVGGVLLSGGLLWLLSGGLLWLLLVVIGVLSQRLVVMGGFGGLFVVVAAVSVTARGHGCVVPGE
jgi:hypothetical protein